MKLKIFLLSSLLICTAVLFPKYAIASGYYVPTRGAETMGRGGANMVNPHGILEALWLNPAALVDAKGLQIQFDANLAYQKSSFARADVPGNSDLSNFETVNNDGGPFITLPAFGIKAGPGTNIGPSAVAISYNIKDKLTLAFGVQGPLGVNESYPANGSQRYSVIASNPVQINFQLALAFKLHPKIAVGMIFQGILMRFHQSMVMGADVLDNEAQDFDNAIIVDGSDPFTGSFALGLRLGKFGPLSISASFSKGIRANADGSLQIEFGEAVTALAGKEGITLEGTEGNKAIGISFNIPDIYRLGVQLAYSKWDLEFNATIEDWHTLDAVYVDTRNITLYNSTLEMLGLIKGVKSFGTIVMPRNWKTSVMLNLGGAYYPVGNILALRGGLFWEQAAIPASSLDTSRMDMPKMGVGTGLGVNIKDYVFIDLAFAYIHSFTTEVTDSDARIIPAIDTMLGSGTQIMQQQIAAGVYKANSFTAALSIRVALPF